jgi:uncharacterized protein HemX
VSESLPPLPSSDLHQRLRTAANVREDYALRQFRDAQLLRQAVDQLEAAQRSIETLQQQVRSLSHAWQLAQAERDRCRLLLLQLGLEAEADLIAPDGLLLDLDGPDQRPDS